MNRIRIYKSYGVIAHESHPVYTIGTPAGTIYDRIEVAIPDGVTINYNAAGEMLLAFDDAPGQTFTAHESLTSRGDKPVLRYWDFNREGPNAHVRWKTLIEITDVGALRRRLGMTQAELSEKSGLKLSTLQKIESGAASIMQARLETVVRLAHALGVNIEDLMS